jgi:FtsZ-binding cell division protein ZapB
MPGESVIPVVVALIVLAGTIWASMVRDRNNPMSQTVTAALATTEVVQSLILPLQAEIMELRAEVLSLRTRADGFEAQTLDLRRENTVLRERVSVLETQIRDLGYEPHPPPPQRGPK